MLQTELNVETQAMPKRALLDLPREELLAWLQQHGQPPMRARQIRRWMLIGRAESFEQMTDLPLNLRQALAAGLNQLSDNCLQASYLHRQRR